MRYLIIEFENNNENDSLRLPMDEVREVLERHCKVTFIGNYPNRAAAQCCSVIREKLIET